MGSRKLPPQVDLKSSHAGDGHRRGCEARGPAGVHAALLRGKGPDPCAGTARPATTIRCLGAGPTGAGRPRSRSRFQPGRDGHDVRRRWSSADRTQRPFQPRRRARPHHCATGRNARWAAPCRQMSRTQPRGMSDLPPAAEGGVGRQTGRGHRRRAQTAPDQGRTTACCYSRRIASHTGTARKNKHRPRNSSGRRARTAAS